MATDSQEEETVRLEEIAVRERMSGEEWKWVGHRCIHWLATAGRRLAYLTFVIRSVLADRIARGVIGYMASYTVVCPSVCDAVYCG